MKISNVTETYISVDVPGYAHGVHVSMEVALYLMQLGAVAQRECLEMQQSAYPASYVPDMLAVLRKAAEEGNG